jgi:hypothetical protein
VNTASTNSERAVLAAIDALIDDQMAAGEPKVGFDFGDPLFPQCRCGNGWHGLPAWGCPGADSEGPLIARSVPRPRCRCGQVEHDDRSMGCPGTDVEGPWDATWLPRSLDPVMAVLRETFAEIGRAFTAAMKSLESAFPHLQETARPPGAAPRPGVRQVPPMWAVDPTRSRRRRTRP